MLSLIFLSFDEKDMQKTYDRDKITFYSKVMPVITITIFLLTAAIEVMIRVLRIGTLNMVTEIFNGSMLLLFIILTILTRKFAFATWFVCPFLTIYVFYYLAFLDYDSANSSIFYTLVIGVTACYFLLVIFTETWVISTGVYAPMLVYFLWKTGKNMSGTENDSELVIRSLFCVFIYGIIAYRVEMLNKEAFLGRETAEKASHRWLKIFEVFPEGLALVRNG
jgi:hypothetical protein